MTVKKFFIKSCENLLFTEGFKDVFFLTDSEKVRLFIKFLLRLIIP